MTESAKQAWGEVGEKFSSFGRGVADRYHEAGSTGRTDADEADRELKRAMKELFDELSKGVSAVGATFKDDQAKKVPDRSRQRAWGCHHRNGERGPERDPLEGRLHASASHAIGRRLIRVGPAG